MLNEKRIRLNDETGEYESGEGKEELRIARYYRSDYIGLAMFRNFFLASLAYLVFCCWRVPILQNFLQRACIR